jgi:pyridoxamine 5'-phosphate oxidase family protein
MSTFTPNELTYLSEQRIGRLATADRNGRPHVVPTGFNIDGEKGVVEIGGHIHPVRGQKRLYLTNLASNPYAAFVIDDLVIDPLTPRAVTVRGKALIHPEGGERLGRGWLSARVQEAQADTWSQVAQHLARLTTGCADYERTRQHT